MRRVLSVYLPLWPVERAMRRQGLSRSHPVLVVQTTAQKRIVVCGCAHSLQSGVRPGMNLAHARALLQTDDADLVDHEPDRDDAALRTLARWAMRFSPVVSADPPDGLLIDITGCEHLFNGERRLARKVGVSLKRLGFTARVAAASTVGAAWGLSRYGPGHLAIVKPGDERHRLAPLPIPALRLEPEVVESLAEVGVERIGEVLDLPRMALPARYGEELLLRIDQALGVLPEPVGRIAEALQFQASMELPGGTVQWEAISATVQRLLGDLCGQLERQERGLRCLVAAFHRIDAEGLRLTVNVSRATRDDAHLWKLLRPKLERLNLGFGIEGITLTAAPTAPLPHAQRSFAGDQPTERDGEGAFAQALDTITNRIGQDRLHRIVLQQSHRPERAALAVPIDAKSTPSRAVDAAPCVPSRPRPSCLFAQPESARVLSLSPDGPILTLWWRDCEYRAAACVGPERIGGEWWQVREPGRDYFRVQDEEGRWLWTFRDLLTGQWFVHGEWA